MINSFTEDYRFLSNFFISEFEVNKTIWRSVEHYYQANKALHQADREKIRTCKTPGQAKKLGAKVLMKPNFKSEKLKVMFFGEYYKYLQNPTLKLKLIGTYPLDLVGGNNWHDNFWGDCQCVKCQSIPENWLGKMLMFLRLNLYLKTTELHSPTVLFYNFSMLNPYEPQTKT